MYRGEDDYGHVYYDVITHKGEVIDVIDECGDSYNIVKFEETGKIERISERMLLQKRYNTYREQVIPHKLNYFDFDKPLKFYVGETEEPEDEGEDEDEQIIW